MRYVVGLLFLTSPALAGEPARPAQKPLVVTAQRPTVVMQQRSSAPPRMRGPLKVRLGTAMADVVTDTTMSIVEEIPGAILDSILKGLSQSARQLEAMPAA